MTGEQYGGLIESINTLGNSFNEDLGVAIISGVVTIIISSMVSYYVSKGQSKNSREEMIMRINKEAEKNLIIQRKIIRENIELEAYNKLDSELFRLSKIPESFVSYVNNEGLFWGWTEEYRYNNLREFELPFDLFKIQMRRVDHYFSEDDLRIINTCMHRISDFFRELVKEGNLGAVSNNPQAYLMTQIDDIVTVVQTRKKKLISKWDDEGSE